MNQELLYQIMNQIPPEVLGQMIAEINDPGRFVRKDMLQKEVPLYKQPSMVGGSNAPLRVPM